MRRIPFLVLVGLCFAAFCSTSDAYEERYIEAEQMSMKGFRVYRNPMGGYSGNGYFALSYVKLAKGQTERRPKNLSLTVKFEKPLPPGRYKVFFKYIDPAGVRVKMGGAEAEKDIRKTGRVGFVEIETQGRATTLSFQVVQCGVRVIYDWFFITDDPACTVKRVAGRYRFVRERPAVKSEAVDAEEFANCIANGSFEAGMPEGWSTPYQANLALFSSMRDATSKVHGQHSLAVPITRRGNVPDNYSSSMLSHAPILVRNGETYSFAFHARSDVRASINVTARMAGSRKRWRVSHAVGADWRRFKLSVGPVPEDGTITLSMSLDSRRKGSVWLDAVCFGKKDTYQSRYGLEAGPAFQRPGNIVHLGKDTVKLALWRAAATPSPTAFEFKVFDWCDSKVREKTIDLSGAPLKYTVIALPVPVDVPGPYRIHYRTILGAKATPWRQTVYTVIPDPVARKDAPIGVYGSFTPQALSIYELLGFRWTCTLSAGGQIGTWKASEPEFGKGYRFFDEDVDNALRNKVNIICNLHTSSYALPAGLPLSPKKLNVPCVRHRQKGYFPLSAWRGFVQAMAERYKGKIRHWLIIDEPASQYSAEDYVKILKTSYEVLKKADPENKVFIHTHIAGRKTYISELDKLGAADYCDALYDYVRTKEAAAELSKWCRKHAKPTWSVEYGGFTTFYLSQQDEPQERPLSIKMRDNVAWTLQSAVRSICWPPAERYFRYDARFPGSHGYMTLFHPDGTIKPAGVALAVLNSKIAGLKGSGEMALPKPLQGFLFKSDEECLLAVRTRSKETTMVRAGLDLAGITVTDAMGRTIRPAEADGAVMFTFDRQFRFISFPADRERAIKEAISSGVLAPAVSVSGKLVRTAGKPLALLVSLKNNTPEDLDLFVTPATQSLFHLKGYIPIRSEVIAFQERIGKRIKLAPNAQESVQFDLNYAPGRKFAPNPGSWLSIALEGDKISAHIDMQLDRS